MCLIKKIQLPVEIAFSFCVDRYCRQLGKREGCYRQILLNLNWYELRECAMCIHYEFNNKQG